MGDRMLLIDGPGAGLVLDAASAPAAWPIGGPGSRGVLYHGFWHVAGTDAYRLGSVHAEPLGVDGLAIERAVTSVEARAVRCPVEALTVSVSTLAGLVTDWETEAGVTGEAASGTATVIRSMAADLRRAIALAGAA